MINARNKGKAGELEFINRFQPFFNQPLKRHLDQWRSGGSDVEGCEPWVIEIKRCQQIEHNKWWKQVNAAVVDPDHIPVVAYRQNNIKAWTFQMPARLIGVDHPGFIIASEDIWLAMHLEIVSK